MLASANGDPLLTEWQYGLGRVITWASDVTNRWSANWLDNGQSFESFWAQVVKRTLRPPEDPNRQISVSLTGDQATISLNAQTRGEGTADRNYVNFLPTTANIIDPSGRATQIQLPRVAPGQYQATLPAPAEGVYTLHVTEQNADGSSATQSSGFVVPYVTGVP